MPIYHKACTDPFPGADKENFLHQNSTFWVMVQPQRRYKFALTIWAFLEITSLKALPKKHQIKPLAQPLISTEPEAWQRNKGSFL